MTAPAWALTFVANTVVFFGEAKEEARKLDAEFSETGRLKGLLHGVPISVKDSCTSLSSLFHFPPTREECHSGDL
jgi:Asp-tRNA(Asn)/Glu-tRNA(Gln) amidotransferase A subunit family amidase